MEQGFSLICIPKACKLRFIIYPKHINIKTDFELLIGFMPKLISPLLLDMTTHNLIVYSLKWIC